MPCGTTVFRLPSSSRRYNATMKDGHEEISLFQISSRGVDIVDYVEDPDLIERSKGSSNSKESKTCTDAGGGIIKAIVFTRAATAAVNSALVTIFFL